MIPNKVRVFSDLIEKNRRIFKIPVYQRNYDWSEIECDKLYSDIIKAYETDKKHFTGTIVYIVDRSDSTIDEALIIDGQQRITTIYVLLIALLDFAQKNKVENLKKEIEQTIFNRYYDDRHCDDKHKLKLKPIKTDNEQLYLLLQNRLDEMDRNSHIYKNYELFKTKIQESLDSKIDLLDILDGIKKLEMVEIILDKSQGDEPQKIFESINSTGLELSLADLIRNYLLMGDDNQDQLYVQYWQPIEKNVGYNNLGEFVITFLNCQVAKPVNQKNAYRFFKEHCELKNLSHENVLKELKRDSRYYGTIIGICDQYFSKKISDALHSFYAIKQTTINPLLLRLLRDYEEEKIDEDTLCRVLDYLLTYLIRITACEINKNLGKFFNSIYVRIIKDDSSYENYYENFVLFLNNIRSNDKMPTDDEFINALIYKPIYKKPICKFLLSTIENSTHEHIDVSNLTIEHILPQKENAVSWRLEVGEDYGRVYETYLHTLGNLTITGYNSELGTKSFSDKKVIIKTYSHANVLNEMVLSAENWNEKAILDRAKSLAKKLADTFDYVKIQTKDVEFEKEYLFTADSLLDLSKLKPCGMFFLGEQFVVKNWSDLLNKMIHAFNDIDSKLMQSLAQNNYSISMIDSILITNDSRVLGNPKQIESTGIFYELGLTPNNIIVFIKGLLLKYGLDTDDFSFSLSELPFDINNEESWKEGAIKVAKLFYNLTDDLAKKGIISDEEIENLKDKKKTKELFSKSDYPAFADKRDDNKGNSTIYRYRREPINYHGREIYITTQFFEEDRDAIINWYKMHI